MKKGLNKPAFIRQFKNNLNLSATSDQADAIDELGSFISSPTQFEIFILSGYAGTGKTTLISAFVQTLTQHKIKSVLLAPTGRAAKVLANYSKMRASTVHRKIYFHATNSDGSAYFALSENKHTNTIFIVDEASMLSTDAGFSSKSSFTPRNLLDDLLEYIYSGTNCKLILVGDKGQLPPIGMSESPALDKEYLDKSYSLDIIQSELSQIVRQENESGILNIAGNLRDFNDHIPLLKPNQIDAITVSGLDLQEEIEASISKFGSDEVMIVTRSNKRANLFNQQVRRRIMWQEEDLNAGDIMMVTKNNYFWLDSKSEAGFLANGEIMEILKIVRRESLYGFEFADVLVRLIDYPEMKEIEIKIILDAIHFDGPSLPREQLKELFFTIGAEEYPLERNKSVRNKLVMNNPYFQAVHVKFGYAITCHKAQGGQWCAVFIDQGYFVEEMWDKEYMRWLYTAVTRASKKLYLVNFDKRFIGDDE